MTVGATDTNFELFHWNLTEKLLVRYYLSFYVWTQEKSIEVVTIVNAKNKILQDKADQEVSFSNCKLVTNIFVSLFFTKKYNNNKRKLIMPLLDIWPSPRKTSQNPIFWTLEGVCLETPEGQLGIKRANKFSSPQKWE